MLNPVRTRFGRLGLAAVIAGATLLAPAAAQAAPAPCTWTPTPLEVASGYSDSYPTATDGRGVVTGWMAPIAMRRQTLVTWENSKLKQHGLAFNSETTGHGINRAGVIVGSADVNGVETPFRYQAGGFARLPLPAGVRAGRPDSINNRGDIVGVADGKLLLWRAQSSSVEVLTLPIAGRVNLAKIDDDGYIAVQVGEFNTTKLLLRKPDGGYLKLDGPQPAVRHVLAGLRGGLVVGADGNNLGLVWDRQGTLVHQIRAVPRAVSATGRVLAYVHPDGPYQIWQNGRIVTSLPANFTLGIDLLEDGSAIGHIKQTGHEPSAHWRCS